MCEVDSWIRQRQAAGESSDLIIHSDSDALFSCHRQRWRMDSMFG